MRKKAFFAKSFTLAELMLIAVFLTVVFVALIASFLTCFVLNETNRNLSIAVTHTQYIMEEIKDNAYTVAGFNNLRTAGSLQWNWNAETDFTNRGLNYLNSENTAVTFTDALTGGAANASTELLDVTVTVNWSDRARNKTMSVKTLIAEP